MFRPYLTQLYPYPTCTHDVSDTVTLPILLYLRIIVVRICEEGLLGVRRSRKKPCSASLLLGNGGNFSRFILHDFLSTSGGNRHSKCFFFFRKRSKCFSTFLRVNWSPKPNKFLNKSLRTTISMFFEVEEGRSYGCLEQPHQICYSLLK